MELDYPAIVERESGAMLEAINRSPLGTIVPSCPDWTVAQLADHLGTVHRWATHIVTHGEAPETFPSGVADPADAPAFLAEGIAPLVKALRSADLGAPCWNFTRSNLTKAFWPRRQAIETASHRWDAQRALQAAGGPDPDALDPNLGADAIDEWATSLVPRMIGRAKLDLATLAGDLHLHCTDVDGEWTLRVDGGQVIVQPGHAKAAAALRAPASDLYLVLLHRATSDRVERFGDEGVIDRWLSGLRF